MMIPPGREIRSEEAAPHKRKPLPLLTPGYRQGMSAFTLRFFEDLFARLKIPSAVGGIRYGF